MSCRRPTTKNLIRKSKSCCNSRYDSDSTSTSDSSNSSSCTSSDSSCGCFDCDCYDRYISPPKRRKGKGKAKGRTLQPKKTSKPCKSPYSAKISKKKPDRRTRGSSSSCGCSKGDCSDMSSNDGEYSDCCDCGPTKPRRKGRRVPKRPRQRPTTGRTSNDQKSN